MTPLAPPKPADPAAIGAAVARLADAARRRGMLWRIGAAGKAGAEVVATFVRLVPTGTGVEDVLCGIGPDVPAAVEALAERARERTGT